MKMKIIAVCGMAALLAGCAGGLGLGGGGIVSPNPPSGGISKNPPQNVSPQNNAKNQILKQSQQQSLQQGSLQKHQGGLKLQP